MKPLLTSKTQRGFSLVELLMALAVISMLAAVAIFNLTGVMGAGKEAAALRNAQQFCETYAAARLKNPRRWIGPPRAWSRPAIVTLNPERVVITATKSQTSAA